MVFVTQVHRVNFIKIGPLAKLSVGIMQNVNKFAYYIFEIVPMFLAGNFWSGLSRGH